MNNLYAFLQDWVDQTPITLILVFTTAAAFLIYGLQIFVSRYMAAEYKRFGMTGLQKNLVGLIQIAGAITLILGISYPYLGLATAFGFVLMMGIALWVRLKLKDSFTESLPALLLFSSSIWLCIGYYQWIVH